MVVREGFLEEVRSSSGPGLLPLPCALFSVLCLQTGLTGVCFW